MLFEGQSLRKTLLASLAIGFCFTTAHAQDAQSETPIGRKSGSVLQGTATRRVEPAYPPLAKAARVSGTVVVEVTVDEEGNVMAARAISGHPLLKDSALTASRGWKFKPTMLDGAPVKVIGTISFNFGLDHSQEIDVLLKEVAADPGSAELRYQLGMLYLESAQPAEAIEPLRQSVNLDPRFVKAYVGLGDAYSRTGKSDLAIDAYREAARIKPDYAEPYFYLGLLYWKSDQNQEAVEAFKQAATINGQMHMAYVGMGRSLAAMGRYQEALEALKQAAAIEPDSLDAHLEMGETYLRLGDKEAAMEEYKILKAIKPFMAEQLLERIKREK